MEQKYDVIVVGGGHAGCEAALAAGRMGCRVALITLDAKKIAEMSCNPSVGGVGKGQLVKELDALGGEMGRNADETAIQFKRLNTRKGSAVQSSRCQSDKKAYAERMQKLIQSHPRIVILSEEVKSLLVKGKQIHGVQTKECSLEAKAVVITSGTFMRGLMHCGEEKREGGRIEEKSSVGLSDQLRELGIRIFRLKTGTPPRLLRDSIDFTKMETQWGDDPPKRFSFFDSKIQLPQVACYLTYTNPDTHQAIRENLGQSPLFSGQIKGVGPRYCPSIEDKVVKFPQKDRHPLFFEPEALDSDWIYPNGISTSLPRGVQEQFVRTLPGCENAAFARYGYAVEYDCLDPLQLNPSLESKEVRGLFLGGQINGTSGYEEAAAQGLMAGINAALFFQGRSAFILSRSESYIGVMIDDLVRLGVNEPYRMFTSRAEYRLLLREDNAHFRLSRRGYDVGLLSESDYRRVEKDLEEVSAVKVWMKGIFVKANEENNEKLSRLCSNPIVHAQSLLQLLKRPELDFDSVVSLTPESCLVPLSRDQKENLEIETKYEGYIKIQIDEIEKMRRLERAELPNDLDYQTVIGLSTEVREKLKSHRPKDLFEAKKISGVTPAALAAILFHVKHFQQKLHEPSPRH